MTLQLLPLYLLPISGIINGSQNSSLQLANPCKLALPVAITSPSRLAHERKAVGHSQSSLMTHTPHSYFATGETEVQKKRSFLVM